MLPPHGAWVTEAMAEAKVGPMRLQCDKVQLKRGTYRTLLYAVLTRKTSKPWQDVCLQPTSLKKTGHTKAEKKKHRRKTVHYDYACIVCIVRNCIPTPEKAMAGCFAGSVASGRTLLVLGMSAAGLCARFAPNIKWHRIAL